MNDNTNKMAALLYHAEQKGVNITALSSIEDIEAWWNSLIGVNFGYYLQDAVQVLQFINSYLASEQLEVVAAIFYHRQFNSNKVLNTGIVDDFREELTRVRETLKLTKQLGLSATMIGPHLFCAAIHWPKFQ